MSEPISDVQKDAADALASKLAALYVVWFVHHKDEALAEARDMIAAALLAERERCAHAVEVLANAHFDLRSDKLAELIAEHIRRGLA